MYVKGHTQVSIYYCAILLLSPWRGLSHFGGKRRDILLTTRRVETHSENKQTTNNHSSWHYQSTMEELDYNVGRRDDAGERHGGEEDERGHGGEEEEEGRGGGEEGRVGEEGERNGDALTQVLHFFWENRQRQE